MKTPEEQLAYISEKLRELTPIFAKASIGDFSENVTIPDENDEVTDVYVGVQIMLEVIRDQLTAFKEFNQFLEERVAVRTTALEEAQRLARVGNWEWKLPSNSLFWSDELYRIHGLDPREFHITYDEYLKRIHPDDLESVKSTVDRAAADHQPFSVKYRIVMPDGRTRVLQGRGQVLLDEAGNAAKMFGTGQDITEQEQFENAIKESEERYRNLVDTAKDVILTISLDGRIASLNPAFEEITGWDRMEWIGKPFGSILHPDDLPIALQRFQRAIQGEALPSHEWRVRSKSGDYLAGEVVTTPLVKGGSIVGLLGIVRDVTDRKRVADALRESEEQYRNLFENARDVIFTLSLGGTITALSPSFESTTGWPRAEWIGKRFATIVHPEDMRTTMETFRRVMKQERALTFELRIRSSTGRYLAGEFMTAPLMKGGKVCGAFGIARDISGRKYVEEMLRASNQQLKEKLDEVERLNEIMMGREERIVELKEQIEELKIQLAAETEGKK